MGAVLRGQFCADSFAWTVLRADSFERGAVLRGQTCMDSFARTVLRGQFCARRVSRAGSFAWTVSRADSFSRGQFFARTDSHAQVCGHSVVGTVLWTVLRVQFCAEFCVGAGSRGQFCAGTGLRGQFCTGAVVRGQFCADNFAWTVLRGGGCARTDLHGQFCADSFARTVLRGQFCAGSFARGQFCAHSFADISCGQFPMDTSRGHYVDNALDVEPFWLFLFAPKTVRAAAVS